MAKIRSGGIQTRNIKPNHVLPVVASSVSDYLDIINAQTSDLTAGLIYYDTTIGQLRTHNGSNFTPAGATGTGPGSWDNVITTGGKVTTDNAAEIELSAATSPLLTLDANGTTNVDIFDISSAAGTGDLISLAQAGSGLDINGTSGTWTVSAAGAAVLNALWLKDTKELQFGTAIGGDVSFVWDTSDLLIEAETDDVGSIKIGSTNALDLAVYGSTNSNIALFDVSTAILEMDGWSARFQDTDELQFGDATGGDVSFVWDTSNLLIEAETQDTGQIRIGSTNAIDLAVYGNTATDIALFDVSTAFLDLNGWGIRLQDADSLVFGDGNDFSLQFNGTDTLIDGATANTIIKIGATNNQDLIIYGATITNLVTFDTDDSALECIFDNFDLRLKDDDYILLGDSATAGGSVDGTIRWDATNSVLEIIGATQFEDNVTMDGNLTLSGTLTMSGALAPGSIALGDTEVISFGDGTDYSISTAGSTAALVITAVNANDAIHIGDGSVATDFLIDNITVSGADVWWDQSADTANGTWFFGKDDAGVDVFFYGATANAAIQWDTSADRLIVGDSGASVTFQDSTDLLFGTGASNAGDFKINSDGSTWFFAEVSSTGKGIEIGVDGKGLDFKMFGETAGDFCEFDQSNDSYNFEDIDIALGDGTKILLGDPLGTGDFSIESTAAVLTIGQVVSGTGTIAMGVDGKGIDQKWSAETTGDFMLWDQDGNSNLGALVFEDSAIQFAGAAATYTYAISTSAMLVTATDNSAAKVTWGDNGTNGLDQEWLSVTSGNLLNWDAGAETLKLTDVLCTMIGADSRGTILAITGIDTTGNTDTVTIDHSGTGSGLKITATEADSVGLELVAAATQTTSLVKIDGSTGSWTGASTTGMLDIDADGLLAADASLVRIESTGAIAAANDGACLEIIETGAQQATTYAVRIASTSNEALHVDSGEVVVDEFLSASPAGATGGLVTKYGTADLTATPTAAEFDTMFGATAKAKAGFLGVAEDSSDGKTYAVVSDGTTWHYVALTAAS